MFWMKEQSDPGLWDSEGVGLRVKVHGGPGSAEPTAEGERRKRCCQSTGLEVATVRLE